MGENIVIETNDDTVVSCCDGIVTSVSTNGEKIEILMNNNIRVGLSLNHQNVKCCVKSNQKINKGDIVFKLNQKESVVQVEILNASLYDDIMKVEQPTVKKGDRIIAII